MKHRHGETEYRGVPWWKRNKDPKIGEDYKDPNQAEQKKNGQSAKRRQKQVIQKKKDSQRQ
jgi:nitric oxide reductase activation protein